MLINRYAYLDLMKLSVRATLMMSVRVQLGKWSTEVVNELEAYEL
jgi:hypothetical protein